MNLDKIFEYMQAFLDSDVVKDDWDRGYHNGYEAAMHYVMRKKKEE